MRQHPRHPIAWARLATVGACLLTLVGCERAGSPAADSAAAAEPPTASLSALPASGSTSSAAVSAALAPPGTGFSQPTPSGPDILLSDHGARCDGTFDNSAALASAIAAARESHAVVRIPRGVCAYGDLLHLDSARLRGDGAASILYALDWRRAAIFMSGEGAEVRDLTLAGRLAPSREAAWETTRITLKGATGFVIDGVTVRGSSAAGIQTAAGAHSGRITRNHIRDTFADAIHMTDGAAHITVEDNLIENAGDDGIAVVSYRRDGALSHHITARRNTVRNSRHGRPMSVVGGADVLYEDNVLENSGKYACVYIAQEASYATYGAQRVVVRGNRLRNCASLLTSHAGIMIFNDGEDPNTDIELLDNVIRQRGQTGIRVLGPLNRNIRLDGNKVQGSLWPVRLDGDGVTVGPDSPAEAPGPPPGR
jgi:hypothetical protein